jgi:hypothetical protein
MPLRIQEPRQHPLTLSFVYSVKMRWLLITSVILIGRVVFADAPIDNAPLGPGAADLGVIINQAKHDGLPAELIVDKVREGLAKGIPASQVMSVARGLLVALAHARAEAQPLIGVAPPPGLLKAIIEARTAGVASDSIVTLLRAGGREQAVQVLTDLVQRGYPTLVAARTVGALSSHRDALEQLVGQAERLRLIEGASLSDALYTLVCANAQGLSLDRAEQLLHGNEANDDNGRGPNRETSGPRGPRFTHGKNPP